MRPRGRKAPGQTPGRRKWNHTFCILHHPLWSIRCSACTSCALELCSWHLWDFVGLCVQRQSEQLREPYQGYQEIVLTVLHVDLTKGQKSRAGFQDELQPEVIASSLGWRPGRSFSKPNTEVPSKGRGLGAAAASAGATCSWSHHQDHLIPWP